MTASKETMSRRHPGESFVPTGNQPSAIATEAVMLREGRSSVVISEPEGVIVSLIGHEWCEKVLAPRRYYATRRGQPRGDLVMSIVVGSWWRLKRRVYAFSRVRSDLLPKNAEVEKQGGKRRCRTEKRVVEVSTFVRAERKAACQAPIAPNFAPETAPERERMRNHVRHPETRF
jgi:hypothetical protein